MQPIEIRRLGMVPYADALALQRELVEERRADALPICCCSSNIRLC